MKPFPLVSIVINNYNYGRFLREAIASALIQSPSNTEIIVVDDGSLDDSREVIAAFGERVLPILKENGGQASALNAGFRAARGEVIFFLDSDDMLLPGAVERVVSLFSASDVVKAHWPLLIVDGNGQRTGETVPAEPLPEGDLHEEILSLGPTNSLSPPMTGNAWSRRFLEQVLPIPEKEYRIGADTYLFELAPLFGTLQRVSEPLGCYRLHGQNHYSSRSLEEQLQEELQYYEAYATALERFCQARGKAVDVAAWRRNSWWHRLNLALQDFKAVTPPGASIVLVDEESWGAGSTLAGRHRIPFLERDGEYWGPPPDDDTAIRELDRLRSAGASFVAIAWPAFWWLDHYAGWYHHLRAQFRCVLQNERLLVFDLRQ